MGQQAVPRNPRVLRSRAQIAHPAIQTGCEQSPNFARNDEAASHLLRSCWLGELLFHNSGTIHTICDDQDLRLECRRCLNVCWPLSGCSQGSSEEGGRQEACCQEASCQEAGCQEGGQEAGCQEAGCQEAGCQEAGCQEATCKWKIAVHGSVPRSTLLGLVCCCCHVWVLNT